MNYPCFVRINPSDSLDKIVDSRSRFISRRLPALLIVMGEVINMVLRECIQSIFYQIKSLIDSIIESRNSIIKSRNSIVHLLDRE